MSNPPCSASIPRPGQKPRIRPRTHSQLTHIETDPLAKGLNFSITSKTLPNNDIIATVEDGIKDLEKEEAETIRAKVSLTLQN